MSAPAANFAEIDTCCVPADWPAAASDAFNRRDAIANFVYHGSVQLHCRLIPDP